MAPRTRLSERGSSPASSEQVHFTNPEWDVGSDKPFVLLWERAANPVNIDLLEEDGAELQFLDNIAVNATGTSYSFKASPSLAPGTYAFKISDLQTESKSPRWKYEDQPADWRPVFGGLMGALLVVILGATAVILFRRRQKDKLARETAEGEEKAEERQSDAETIEGSPRLSRASSITIVEEGDPFRQP